MRDTEAWLDDEVWLELLEPMLMEDAALALRAAKLWHYLLSEIESGPLGITHARQCLENAIRLTFSFTEAHKACRTLFELSLADDFKEDNDPVTILTNAIDRAKLSEVT